MKPHAAQAKRLASAIAGSGMTNAAAADAAGMPRQVLANMLAGNTPGRAHLPKLAAVLKVPMDWLSTGDSASVGEKVELYALRLAALDVPRRARAQGIAAGISSLAEAEPADAARDLKGDEKEAFNAYTGLDSAVPAVAPIALGFEQLLAVIPALLMARDELRKSKKASLRRLAVIESVLAALTEDCPGMTSDEDYDRLLKWSAMVNDAQRAFERVP